MCSRKHARICAVCAGQRRTFGRGGPARRCAAEKRPERTPLCSRQPRLCVQTQHHTHDCSCQSPAGWRAERKRAPAIARASSGGTPSPREAALLDRHASSCQWSVWRGAFAALTLWVCHDWARHQVAFYAALGCGMILMIRTGYFQQKQSAKPEAGARPYQRRCRPMLPARPRPHSCTGGCALRGQAWVPTQVRR